MFGRIFRHGSGVAKWLIIAVASLVLIMLCVITYFWAVHPIVSQFLVSKDCIYHDLEYYVSEEYLDFEDGTVFQTMLSDFEVEETGKVIDFYYADGYVKDNPLRGKACDIYALDVTHQQEEYLSKKKHYEESYQNAEPINDYLLYAELDTFEKRTFVKGAAFCDETCTVRYVLIADFDSLYNLSSLFYRNSNLEWKAQPSIVAQTNY